MPSAAVPAPASRSGADTGWALAAYALWLLSVAVGLWFRPLLPIDETRYLTVAWEMHLSGNWLVPHLNGEAYSHKPPLLFWLINLSWLLFGVGETAARIVSPLFTLGSLALTGVLARLLWPGEPGRRAASLAPLVVLGSAYLLFFSTLTYFDLMMTFFALAGIIGLVVARRGRMVAGFGLFGLAIGLGVLSKGPAILVYLLPAALLAPLWARGAGWTMPFRAAWWYVGAVSGIALGAAIALLWALPAAKAGGPAFENAILWGQTAGRMRDSFAHRQPFWWYLPVLPLMLFPWVVWPPMWRAVRGLRDGIDPGLRLCLTWFIGGVVVFSAVSGKQPHYLLPLVPAFALFLTRQLETQRAEIRQSDGWFPAVLVVLAGVLALSIPVVLDVAGSGRLRAILPVLDTLGYDAIGAALCLAAVPAFLVRLRARPHVLVPALLPLTFGPFLAFHLFVMPSLRPNYDLLPAATAIAGEQLQGREIGFAGDYHGEYTFLGRLTRPLAEFEPRETVAWATAHPDAIVLTRHRELPTDRVRPVATFPFRGRLTAFWYGRDIAAHPEVFAVK